MSAGRNPGSATTPEDFVELLRDIRADSGLSFWEIQRIAHDHGYDLEPAAMVHALGQPVLPKWEIVAGLLVACGYQRKQIDGWLRVYRDLAAHAAPPRGEEEPDVAEVPARRWTYQHILYAAAGGAVAIFVLLVAATWDGGRGPDAALTSSSTISPTQGRAESAPAVPKPVPEAASTPPAAAASQPPPPASQNVLPAAGTVTLASGQGVDLESGTGSGDLDIVATSGTGLTVGDNRKRLQRMTSMPTEQTCRSLNLGRLERDIEDLTAGQWLCVLTSSGRWARVNITSTGDSIALSYLVWA